MNSEHRHELNRNVLGTFIGGILKQVEPYTKIIAIVFALAVFGAVALGVYKNSETEARSDATLELLQNANGGDAEALAEVGDRYAKTPAGAMARLYEADTNLSAGITALFSDREEAEAKIDDSIKAYREVTASVKDRLLVSRANFGMGRALESLGKVEDAVAAYQKVVLMNESDAVVSAAQQRIDLLKKAETQEFLAWFGKQDFKPADPSMPPLMPSGNMLPDLPDLDLPEIPALKLPDELKSNESDKATPAPGTMSLPASGETAVPATDALAPAAPASEAPAPPAELPAAPVVDDAAAIDPAKPVDAATPADAPETTPALDNPTVSVTDEAK